MRVVSVIIGIVLITLEAFGRDLHWAVCIDPGHGGTVPGETCPGGGIREADLNYAIGEGVYWILRPEIESDVEGELPPHRGYVSLTRFADQCPEQWQRARIGQGKLADAFGRVVKPDSTWADVFISIHFDSHISSGGSLVLIYGSPNWGCPSTVIDSSCAFGLILMSCHVLTTGSVWGTAGAKSCTGFYPLPEDEMYTDPRKGGIWLRNQDATVLTHQGWEGAPSYHARCILECEALNQEFCNWLRTGNNLSKYIDRAIEGIVAAERLYRQKADPGGRVRVVFGR